MAVDFDEAVTDMRFAPKYNEHTTSILREAGCSHAAIEDFKSRGIIS